MNSEIFNLMKVILQQTAGVQKLTTQQQEAANLSDTTMLELEALQIELEKNTNKLKTALNQ
jgi:hypothetical protein